MRKIKAWFVTYRNKPVSLRWPTRTDHGRGAMNAALRSADRCTQHHPHTAPQSWGAAEFEVTAPSRVFCSIWATERDF